jgi:hypothetical protein
VDWTTSRTHGLRPDGGVNLDKSCDNHSGNCTGLYASDDCGGRWEEECADDHWTCMYDDACLKNGGVDCNGHCKLH